MKCAIMQPTYLPWAGYFNLMASVDRCVLLDDVQFERRSWQSCNRILLNGKVHYLTVPVRKAAREEVIKNIIIDNDQDWRGKHQNTLKQAYRRTPNGEEALYLVTKIFRHEHSYLADLNEDLIVALRDFIGLNTPLCRASTLSCGGKRSDHLAEICRMMECSEYISPAGSRKYMTEDNFADKSGIGLTYQDYSPSQYTQYGTEDFVSHLSIIDVLANHGPEFARTYILQGNKR